MRALVSFLLCLAVAFQGVANAHVLKQSCPMEQGMQVVAMDASAPADDCCNDADTASKTGEPCKSGQECSVSLAFAVIPLTVASRAAASCRIAPTADFNPLSFDPSAVWRPPTSS